MNVTKWDARIEAEALAERAGIDMDDHDMFVDDLTDTLVRFAARPVAALERPFCVLFLDGRNEHGSHVLPSFPRSFDITETNIEDEAETILSAAESLGFAVGDHVWAEFTWNPPQIGDEGRIEFVGYWEFERINAEMTRATSPTLPVGGSDAT